MKPDVICPRCSAVIPRIVVDAGQPCPTCVRRAGMVKNWDPKARVNRRAFFSALAAMAVAPAVAKAAPGRSLVGDIYALNNNPLTYQNVEDFAREILGLNLRKHGPFPAHLPRTAR